MKKKKKKQQVKTSNNFFFFSSLLFLSFIIVAFGQPVWVGWLGYLAAFLGYALFWRSLFYLDSKRKRFILATIWFAAVHSVGLSWMTATDYHGVVILLVYLFVLCSVGVQFGFLSLFIVKHKSFTYRQMLFIASVWTVFEWARLFFLSGYTWNPVGMAYATNIFSSQIASLVGIYGMSFWVIFVNTVGFKALFIERSLRLTSIWLLLFLCPYLYGVIHYSFQCTKIDKGEFYSVILVQPAVFPEYKKPVEITPLMQWQRILQFIQNVQPEDKIDLIVLSESIIPYGAYQYLYSLPVIIQFWENFFGKKALLSMPGLSYPLAWKEEKKEWLVSNAFLAQSLSNHYNAEVIIGLEDTDDVLKRSYNAAFFVRPYGCEMKRYEKQILVPMGEYLPFYWCKNLAAKFGISGQFTPGRDTKVFFGKQVPMGISICYEETYGDVIRKNRKKGARLFVNITNDVWFPHSTLPHQHFALGRLRAIENGVPLIRACNTGITGGVDSLGRVVKTLEVEDKHVEEIAGALHVKIPLHYYPTLYTVCGDKCILSISCLCIMLFLRQRKNRLPYKK